MMNRHVRVLASLLFSSALPGAAVAADHVQSLFIMPLVYTQERGETQVEVRSRALAFEYGLTDDLQVELERGTGGEASLALKRHFAVSGGRIEGAAGIEAGRGTDGSFVEPFFVVAHDFSRAQVSANVAAAFTRSGIDEYRLGGVAIVPAGRSRLTAEVLWTSNANERWNLAPGVAVPFGEAWEIAGSVLFQPGRGMRPQILGSVRLNF